MDKMTRREVIRTVLEGKRPPYVPWDFSFTVEAWDKLRRRSTEDIDDILRGHILWLDCGAGFFEDIGGARVRDIFGVVWDRSRDQDIGVVEGCVLPEPTLGGYSFPDTHSPLFLSEIDKKIDADPDLFRVFRIGFSLYERAWTLRGMENLMMDFIENPEFAHELLGAIADHHIALIHEAMRHDIDAVYFGDDWGQQCGLQMGPKLWHEFIGPQVRRMYAVVREASKFVMIHSCGDVDELFDDLIDMGLNCFNPFQPEVMDVDALVKQYRGRLAFHGGLSTQRTLPYGSVDDVRAECRHLLEIGRDGGFVFAPAHAVEGDVPLDNLIAFITSVREQPNHDKIV